MHACSIVCLKYNNGHFVFCNPPIWKDLTEKQADYYTRITRNHGYTFEHALHNRPMSLYRYRGVQQRHKNVYFYHSKLRVCMLTVVMCYIYLPAILIDMIDVEISILHLSSSWQWRKHANAACKRVQTLLVTSLPGGSETEYSSYRGGLFVASPPLYTCLYHIIHT